MRSVALPDMISEPSENHGCLSTVLVQYASKIYDDQLGSDEIRDDAEEIPSDKIDIEKEVSQEVTGIKEARQGLCSSQSRSTFNAVWTYHKSRSRN